MSWTCFCNFTLCQSSFGKHQEGATGSNFAIPFQYHLIKIICICRWSPGPNLSIIGKQCFLNIQEIQGRGDIISEKRKKIIFILWDYILEAKHCFRITKFNPIAPRVPVQRLLPHFFPANLDLFWNHF